MGQYNTAVLTTVGQALLTSVLGNQGTLTFSKFQTSSYQYASGTDLAALTSLLDVEQEVVPSAGGITDATTFYTSSTVSNTGVAAEYDCNTVGLFASDGNSEVLFAVSTAILPDLIPEDDGGSPSTYTYTMSIGVSSTANITVEVDDQGILRVTSIVDNLTSTSTTQPLSAKQGNILDAAKAERSDVSTIVCTGSANTTGDTIEEGVYFYLNRALCKALANIANLETFTLNTNFKVVSICEELTQLNSKTAKIPNYASGSVITNDYAITSTRTDNYTATSDCWVILILAAGDTQSVGSLEVFINEISVMTLVLTGTLYDKEYSSLPLRKGDIVSSQYTRIGSITASLRITVIPTI